MNRTYTVAASSVQTASIIFLHGLGDTGAGWSSDLSKMKPANAGLICPTAKSIPVALNGNFVMPSWFNLYSLDIGGRVDNEGIEEARAYVHELIQSEEKKGIPTNRILLGGFSQGGALALYSGLTYPKQLAGILALSCWLPLHDSIKFDNPNVNTQVLQCHGEDDTIVNLSWGQLTRDFLKNHLKNYSFKTYKNLGHSTSNEEIRDMREFIQTLLKD